LYDVLLHFRYQEQWQIKGAQFDATDPPKGLCPTLNGSNFT